MPKQVDWCHLPFHAWHQCVNHAAHALGMEDLETNVYLYEVDSDYRATPEVIPIAFKRGYSPAELQGLIADVTSKVDRWRSMEIALSGRIRGMQEFYVPMMDFDGKSMPFARPLIMPFIANALGSLFSTQNSWHGYGRPGQRQTVHELISFWGKGLDVRCFDREWIKLSMQRMEPVLRVTEHTFQILVEKEHHAYIGEFKHQDYVRGTLWDWRTSRPDRTSL